MQIKNISDEIIWEGEAESLRDAVEQAIKEDVDLHEANLEGANLYEANLRRANLRMAYLRMAYLHGAYLEEIKKDYFQILSIVPNEITGLYMALVDGRINGSVYEGKCACLVGTIAKLKCISFKNIEGLKPDSKRPAEKWFLAINEGDTPDNNQVSNIVKEWTEEFCSEKGIKLPKRKVIWE